MVEADIRINIEDVVNNHFKLVEEHASCMVRGLDSTRKHRVLKFVRSISATILQSKLGIELQGERNLGLENVVEWTFKRINMVKSPELKWIYEETALFSVEESARLLERIGPYWSTDGHEQQSKPQQGLVFRGRVGHS